MRARGVVGCRHPTGLGWEALPRGQPALMVTLLDPRGPPSPPSMAGSPKTEARVSAAQPAPSWVTLRGGGRTRLSQGCLLCPAASCSQKFLQCTQAEQRGGEKAVGKERRKRPQVSILSPPQSRLPCPCRQLPSSCLCGCTGSQPGWGRKRGVLLGAAPRARCWGGFLPSTSQPAPTILQAESPVAAC